MFFIPQANQSDPEQRGLPHVNRNPGIGSRNRYCGRLPLLIRNAAQIDHRKRDEKMVFDLLKGLAVQHHETRAPSFMAPENFVEAAL